MKKFLLCGLLGGLVATTANAQVPNSSFEDWKLDTSVLDVNASGVVLQDTFDFEDPIDWTSVNYITGADTFAPGTGVIMVTKSTDAKTGSYAAQIETKAITLMGMQLPIPGFIISGEFTISVNDLMSSGGFSPTSLPGSGIPITDRLASFEVSAKYTPVNGDSALLLAVLRKGTDIVALAQQYVGATNGYEDFSVPFNYISCEMPDSLTYAFASSDLYELQNLLSSMGGTTSIQIGSTLLVDDVSFTEAPSGFQINPIATQDDTVVIKNNSVSVDVLANDEDCNAGATLSLGAISTTTSHGSATKNGSVITYTPDNNYVGFDTVFYELESSTGLSAQGILRIRINDWPAGIADVDMVNVTAYPNPTNSTLNIAANIENGTLNVFDLSGRKVVSSTFNHQSVLDVTTLSVGTYFVNLVNEQGAIIGKTKFFVAQ